jgi:hypothetical protein
MKCVRAFAVCIEMRDMPSDAEIPESFVADTRHHDERLEAARVELEEISALTAAECEVAADAAFEEETRRYEEYLRGARESTERYERMLAYAHAWEIPESLRELKEFMIEQLQSSIRFDGRFDMELPLRQTGEEWYEDRCKDLRWDVEYHARQRDRLLDNAREQTVYLQNLRAALDTWETKTGLK